MNFIVLIGNVGQEPVIREVGKSLVANFSLATSERWKDKDGAGHEKTTWHDVVIWGSLAMVVEKYVTKGKKIAVVGRIEKRQWEAKDGTKRLAVEVIADRLELLGDAPRRHDDLDDLDDEEPERRRRSTGRKRSKEASLDDELNDEVPF